MWKCVPWVNLWMMAFGGAGIWIIADDYRSFSHFGTRVDLVIALCLLTGVALVGLLRLPVPSHDEETQQTGPSLNDLGNVYLSAWKRLWGEKWILAFFGIISSVIALGGLVEWLVERHYVLNRMPERWPSTGIPDLYSTFMILGRRLPGLTTNTLNWFFPHIKLALSTGGIIVIAGATVVAMPWLYMRLNRVRREEECGKEVHFLQVALVVIGIAAVATVSILPNGYVVYLQALLKDSRHFPKQAVSWIVVREVWTLAQSVLGAFLTAGLLGLLKAGTQRATVDSFLRASAHYFKPLAGLYLAVAVLTEIQRFFFFHNPPQMRPAGQFYYTLQMLPVLITMLLMFAPVAMVLRGIGTWEGIRAGVKNWISNAWQTASFVCLGVTFVLAALSVISMIDQLATPMTMTYGVILPIRAAGDVLITAVMLLAVWEFYQLISKEGRVDQPET